MIFKEIFCLKLRLQFRLFLVDPYYQYLHFDSFLVCIFDQLSIVNSEVVVLNHPLLINYKCEV